MSSPSTSLEERIGLAVPVHPHVLSIAKVVVVTPLVALTLKPFSIDPSLSSLPALTVALFFAFLALDALDGVVARARKIEGRLGRVLDRVTDFPLLAVVGAAAIVGTDLPREVVAAKLALDGLAGVLSLLKGRAVDDRVRVSVSDVTTLAMLFLVQGFAPPFLTVDVVSAMLWINIAFSAVIGLYNAGILQKRFIADALSASNALCGVASIYFATLQQPSACLLLLLVGAGFDGLDGAAARKWGGTKFGVYSDDIADGINYAIAPGVALAYSLAGVEGTVVGVAFSLLTISRLVFFTLNKSGGGDPNYFAGVPSTIGGIVALCALILFVDDRAIVGLLVGVAVVLMVSFDSAYRHLGRVMFAARRSRVAIAFVAGVVVVAGGLALGPRVPVAVVLGLCLVYGFFPQVLRFRQLLVPTSKGVPGREGTSAGTSDDAPKESR